MSASPSRVRYAAKSSSRPALRGAAWTIRRAARFAVQLASRSIGSCGVSQGGSCPTSWSTASALVLRQRGVLGDPLDAQVDRVEEPARAGQVRRGLHRRQRLGGVQRVDQDVVGPQLAGRPDGEVGEVGQVAEPPAAAGADAVELGGEPPLAPPVGPLGEAEPGGRDDQVGARLGVAAAGPEQVVAQRQVGRHRERRLADPAARRSRGARPSGRPGRPGGRCRPRARPTPRPGRRRSRAPAPTRSGPRPSPRSAAASAATGSCSFCCRARSGSAVSTPMAASTASIVSAVTWTCRPRQSAYSVMTP